MKKICIIILSLLVLSACEEKEIRLYPSFKESADKTIETTGEFEEQTVYDAQEIKDAIADLDIEEDGDIEGIFIEGMWIEVTPLQNNTADRVTVDIVIRAANASVKYLLDDYVFDIPTTKKRYDLPEYLKKEGVLELRDQLEAIIIDQSKIDDIKIDIEGEPSPAESTIHLELKVFLKGSVVVKQIVEMI